MSIKSGIQYGVKCLFDVAAFLPLLTYILVYRLCCPRRLTKPRILFGVQPNNSLVYVRNAMVERGYDTKIIPWIIPSHEKGVIKYDMDIASKFPRLYNSFLGQLLLIYAFFCYAIYRFDVFIMPFQNRLLDRTGWLVWYELQLLKLAGKKIIINPYGGDIQSNEVWKSRKDPVSQELYQARISDSSHSQISDTLVKKNNAYVLRYADEVILSIDWPDYLPKGNYRYLHLRCAPEISMKTDVKTTKRKKVRIFHATNHAHFKGTAYMEKAVEAINASNDVCELVVVKNLPNTEVLKEIAKADVVFDQLLLGAYGRLAIEAMSMGKPVICCLREDFIDLYPQWKESGIINASIHDLQEKLEWFIGLSDAKRKGIGQKSLAYVKYYHSAEYVGEKLDEIIASVMAN